jgi:hypothetical protein
VWGRRWSRRGHDERASSELRPRDLLEALSKLTSVGLTVHVLLAVGSIYEKVPDPAWRDILRMCNILNTHDVRSSPLLRLVSSLV